MRLDKYLAEKYRAYSRNDSDKVFSVAHIQEELLCNYTIAQFHIKAILGRAKEKLTYPELEKVICETLEE